MSPAQKSNMQAEWEMWQHLIRRDIETLEHRIQFVYSSMSTFSVGREDREQFVLGKVIEMIREVTGQGERMKTG